MRNGDCRDEGAQGSGKSMSMVFQLEEYRKYYGNSLFIATNFGLRLYEGAQGSGKSMSMVFQLEEYRKY